MKAVRRFFHGLRLSQKFFLVVFLLAVTPVTILSGVLFHNMQSVVVEDKLSAVAQDLLLVRARMEKTQELCNMTTQVFQRNQPLREFLLRTKTGAHLSQDELIAFYRNEVGAMERLVNANPYLYQVRVYFQGEETPELMPILYHNTRMEQLSWWADFTPGWQLDYSDAIFPEVVMKPVPHLMSLVSIMEDYRLGPLATLEVAVRMEEQLPGLFRPSAATPSCLMLEGDDGPVSLGGGDLFSPQVVRQALTALDSDVEGVQLVNATLGGAPALLSAIYLEGMGGWYLTALFPREISAGLDWQRNLFLLGTGTSLILLAIAINLLVKAMLRRFYLIVSTVTQVGDGNLEVRVPHLGQDEVGVLGQQLNAMIGRILQLMDENVSRQLLAKNAQIRALQSQINAHFLYNALESIKMMAEVEARYEIADAITALGKLLRYSMRWNASSVTLAEELDNVESYLALVNLRFGYRITLVSHIPPEALGQKLPKLSLQPIAENAVVHGMPEDSHELILEMTAQIAPPYLELSLCDHGQGISPQALEALQARLRGQVEETVPESSGIGLKNVHDRILMAFGAPCGLTVSPEAGGGTRVTLRIPYTEGET